LVALFAATAQNLAHRDAKLPLLQRYKDLDYAGPLFAKAAALSR